MASHLDEKFHLLASSLSKELRCGCDTPVIQNDGSKQDWNDLKFFLSENYDRVEFSAASLSLAHKDPLEFDHRNPREAEQSAHSLLSRSVNFTVETTQSSSIGETTLARLEEIGNLLLLNVSESFALLVDSRLRAHATFLASHGLSLSINKQDDGFALLDQKLGTLLDLGNRVAASSIETKFEIVEEEEDQRNETTLCSSLNFQASLQLGLESLDGIGYTSALPARFEAPGSLTLSKGRSCEIKLEIDCKSLLAQMKQRAADIVSHVVDTTNSFYVLPKPKMTRGGDSFIVMPPPPRPSLHSHQQRTLTHHDDERSLALVSPDVSATPADGTKVPAFMLEDDLTSTLSPNQCANILDDVFGSLDVTLFACNKESERPPKKARIS